MELLEYLQLQHVQFVWMNTILFWHSNVAIVSVSMITSNWVATWARIKVRGAIVKLELLELHLLVKGIQHLADTKRLRLRRLLQSGSESTTCRQQCGAYSKFCLISLRYLRQNES